MSFWRMKALIPNEEQVEGADSIINTLDTNEIDANTTVFAVHFLQ